MVGERDLHRGVDGLGTRIREKYAIEIAGRQLGDTRTELEGFRVATQERRDEIQLLELLVHSLRNFLAPVARRAAEHARRGIDQLLAAIVPVVHALGANDEHRRRFEFAIRRERHPVFVKRNSSGLWLIVKLVFGVTHRGLQWAQASGPARAMR